AGSSPRRDADSYLSEPRSNARDRADRGDRVGLGGVLVRAVALDAGEAQRDAARVAPAPLHPVEGDLDDELGTDVDGVAVAARLQPEELLRLPGEHLVRHPLERLPEHHEV